MSDFGSRVGKAIMLDKGIYEEVEADSSALGQATGVVVLSSIAAGIGTYQQAGAIGLVLGLVSALLGWYIWAYLTYFIGAKLLPESQTEADHGQLLRTLGFASAPGLFRVFGIVPLLGGVVMFVASLWMLAATVIAVRQALDYTSTARAFGVCLIGWLIQMLLVGLVYFVFGGYSQVQQVLAF
ncbi:MAG: YIP1 family protein [Chitinivibrionales bacterium]